LPRATKLLLRPRAQINSLLPNRFGESQSLKTEELSLSCWYWFGETNWISAGNDLRKVILPAAQSLASNLGTSSII